MTHGDPDDVQALAQAALGGEARAFERFVVAVAPFLHRVAMSLTGNGSDADDLIQDSLVRVYLAFEQRRYRAQGSPHAWLRTVITRVALDSRRTRRRRRRREEQWSPPPVAADRSEGMVALQQIHRQLATLPDNQRVAFVLKELEGMTTREIAETMGCSPGAVEQRLVRARATLRERLAHER